MQAVHHIEYGVHRTLSLPHYEFPLAFIPEMEGIEHTRSEMELEDHWLYFAVLPPSFYPESHSCRGFPQISTWKD